MSARKLAEIARDRKNGVMFVVASSVKQHPYFLNCPDVAIGVYQSKMTGTLKAVLMRHYSMKGTEFELKTC